MGRGEKAVYNSATSILAQVVEMISAFILPRLIMTSFGSAYNGITSSVTQFLSVIALLRGGVGGATRVALYKALANKDTNQISATVRATEIFMRKIALVFAGFIVLFSCLYPLLVQNEFEWLFSASLVLIISISTFVQYFFGITYQFLLQAHQRQYITTLINVGTVILNVILSVILIKAGFGIHAVKLGSAVAFSITPVVLHIYCKKHYSLKKDIAPDNSSISQRWDAFYHQVAAFVHNNTDITLLTIFSNTKVISVYTTYYLVGNGIQKILLTIATGVEAAFGDIIARNQTEILKKDLLIYETMIHILSCVLFGAALVLITPFVMVYTLGVNDVNYVRYAFGYLVILSSMLYCWRSPYEAIVNAAGHFKQTKIFAFSEAGINLVVSLCLVWKYDLLGVVIGTTVAILYRNIVYNIYSAKNIVHRSPLVGIKRFLVSGATMGLIAFLSILIPMPKMVSYWNWILYAIPVTLIAIVVTVICNFLFYKQETIVTGKKLLGIARRFVKKRA